MHCRIQGWIHTRWEPRQEAWRNTQLDTRQARGINLRGGIRGRIRGGILSRLQGRQDMRWDTRWDTKQDTRWRVGIAKRDGRAYELRATGRGWCTANGWVGRQQIAPPSAQGEVNECGRAGQLVGACCVDAVASCARAADARQTGDWYDAGARA